ncbi:hypothetical protein HOLleu_25860 [Holothuria leucospilota]|uniref:Uncharacterized protein n=1 Tax=Holothuria leucospilota TaxID=206669 RepID=A0A9Q1H242_HOLLE|nr:hypothetical protein HOLleu_25860 [Holothuria leucospilota]
MVGLDFNKALENIKGVLRHWSKRQLTVLGKVTVVKSLALSKLTYLLMSLPNPDESFVTNLQRLLFKFVWNEKLVKVKRT